MSTKNPFFVSPPTDFQQYGSGHFRIYWAGRDIKFSIDSLSWQTLPAHVIWNRGTYKKISDTTANDNDKTFTVPSDKYWTILYGWIRYTSTATVGSRVMRFDLKDSSGSEYYLGRITDAISASTTIDYMLHTSGDENVTGEFSIPIPLNNILEPSGSIRFHNTSNIDVNDDFNWYMVVNEFDSLSMNSLEIHASDLQIAWTNSIISGSEQKVHVLKLD
jgi:hypothetical protein